MMEDPAPNLPGGLHLLYSFMPGRQMQYSRLIGGVRQVLKPPEVPGDFGTAQVIGQSARAAGAPRSEGGERGDLWHARINSRSGGGAALLPCRARLRSGSSPTWRSGCGWTCGCPHSVAAASRLRCPA
jgi:hypothetical protein